MKIIQGPQTDDFCENMTHLFKEVKKLKPDASRNESRETFLLLEQWDQSQTPKAIEARIQKQRQK